MMTVAIVLAVAWALALLTSHDMGGLVHLLLFASVVLGAIYLIRGRKVFG